MQKNSRGAYAEMIRIAIVEDDQADAKQLADCLERFQREQGESFSVRTFPNPAEFLDTYGSGYDLVFMDIELPMFNGMEAARQLRKIDSVVTLVFITNMEQYAVSGYEVEALDFVVKPINYYRFSSMLRRALRNIDRRAEKEVIVQSAGSFARLRASEIYYVEIRDHLLIYYTDQGRFESWGKMGDLEAELAPHGFVRCSNSHLVNLRHVLSMDGDDVNVAGTKLPVSQRRRKAFYASVTRYLSGK